MTDITLACYVRPAGRFAEEGDAGNIDAREGTVWAIERIGPTPEGELFELLHVVHVHHGQLRFGSLRADQVGSITPPAPADLDSLIKLAGKHLLAKGRRSDDPYFAVVQICRQALTLPAFQPDMPSVFGDDDAGDARPVCAECGIPLRDGICARHGAAEPTNPVTTLLRRLDALDQVDAVARNEIRRQARTGGLGYLEAGAELSLADVAAYTVLITRWERHAARHQVAS